MAAGRIAATLSASALVFFSRHRDCHVMEPFGNRSGASGHVSFFRDSATLRGGFVGLRGRFEGYGVMASLLFCVGGCAVMGTVCDRMLLHAPVFICCCCCLFLF
ncbi:hypothetical protein TcG_10387 [Trypanosoma cruzi]|nr:hypothetical protein TcG_10387 [Trypanosoma cruzi]